MEHCVYLETNTSHKRVPRHWESSILKMPEKMSRTARTAVVPRIEALQGTKQAMQTTAWKLAVMVHSNAVTHSNTIQGIL